MYKYGSQTTNAIMRTAQIKLLNNIVGYLGN